MGGVLKCSKLLSQLRWYAGGLQDITETSRWKALKVTFRQKRSLYKILLLGQKLGSNQLQQDQLRISDCWKTQWLQEVSQSDVCKKTKKLCYFPNFFFFFTLLYKRIVSIWKSPMIKNLNDLHLFQGWSSKQHFCPIKAILMDLNCTCAPGQYHGWRKSSSSTKNKHKSENKKKII